MPYAKWEDVNPSLKGIKPKITLGQANLIAKWADKIKGVKSPWAVAIAQFKESYKVVAGKWVKRGDTMLMRLQEAWDVVASYMLKRFERHSDGEDSEERALAISQVAQQVVHQLSDLGLGMAYIHDVYLDNGGVAFVIVSSKGKLYKLDLKIVKDEVVVGEPQVVVQDFRPPGKRRTIVRKQADGTYRWLCISATAVLNKSGMIDSMALFDCFIDHAERTGEYPTRQFFHTGPVIGTADFLARDGYAFLSSGVFADSPVARAMAKAHAESPEEWVDSIGFLPTSSPDSLEIAGVTIPVYTKGVLREISSLPNDCAAGWFVISHAMEVQRMKKAILNALGKLKKHGLTQADIDEFVEEVDTLNRDLSEGDHVTRDAGNGTETVDTEAADPAVPLVSDPATGDSGQEDPDGVEIVIDEVAVEALAAQVEIRLKDSLAAINQQMDAMSAAIEEMARAIEDANRKAKEDTAGVSNRVAQLEQGDEEKRETWLADLPRSGHQRVNITFRPKQARAPEVSDGKPPSQLAEAANETLATMPQYS